MRATAAGLSPSGRMSGVARIGERQLDDEGRALAVTTTQGLHGAAVQAHEVPDDRQAKSQAAMRPRRSTVGLPEAVEYERQELGRDANAGIGDRQPPRCHRPCA